MRPVLILALLVGCVPKGKFELVQIQLEATQTSMNIREAASRKELATVQAANAKLLEEIDQRNTQSLALQKRIALLERQVDEEAARQANLLFEGLEVCPPLPEPPPCPDCAGEPVERPPAPEEPPEVTERRKLVDASLQEVTEALQVAVRQNARAAERANQHALVLAAFAPLVAEGYAEVLQTDEGSMVRLLAAKLFNENRTTLSPLGDELVQRLATGLNTLPALKLSIVGHTDDTPVSSVEYPSNWELGFAYAVGMLRGLEYEGLTLQTSVVSRAASNPVLDEPTPAARRLNRRVELVLTPNNDVLNRVLVEGEPTEEPTDDEKQPEGMREVPKQKPPQEAG